MSIWIKCTSWVVRSIVLFNVCWEMVGWISYDLYRSLRSLLPFAKGWDLTWYMACFVLIPVLLLLQYGLTRTSGVPSMRRVFRVDAAVGVGWLVLWMLYLYVLAALYPA